MDVKPHKAEEKTTVTILVTGANSGLGFSICCRLIDEFLHTRPQSQTLHLLFSTRDKTKSEDTLKRLNEHLQKALREANGRTMGISRLLEARIKMEGVLVDLTKLLTVKALAKQLLQRGQRLDAVIWNAGVAGWTGVNYAKATIDIIKGPIRAVTCPEFMHCDVGLMAGAQLPTGSTDGASSKMDEPRLGQVFTANVFGHYMLTHWLAPLLHSESRIIWISSTSALPELFSTDDMQRVRATMAYESSKRLTDLLVLTSELPSTKPWVDTLLQTHAPSTPKPKMYVTHPGIIGTSIFALPWFMYWGYILVTYFARWIGSPWHCIDPYRGAVSAVFAALAPPSQLADYEVREGKGKWGSATDVWGEERVARTQVTGWGYNGQVGAKPNGSVSIIGYPETNKEMREEFEVQGREVWKEMEAMRIDWEERLGNVDAADSIDM